MPMYNPNQRDDIADTLMQQRGASTFDYGLAGLGSAQQAMVPPTGPQLPGLPVTPAGGVPGAGIAPAGPSNVQLPPQRMGMQGGMPSMPTLGGIGAPPMGGMGQQRRRPGMPY
jgi:hypothetical protein